MTLSMAAFPTYDREHHARSQDKLRPYSRTPLAISIDAGHSQGREMAPGIMLLRGGRLKGRVEGPGGLAKGPSVGAGASIGVTVGATIGDTSLDLWGTRAGMLGAGAGWTLEPWLSVCLSGAGVLKSAPTLGAGAFASNPPAHALFS